MGFFSRRLKVEAGSHNQFSEEEIRQAKVSVGAKIAADLELYARYTKYREAESAVAAAEVVDHSQLAGVAVELKQYALKSLQQKGFSANEATLLCEDLSGDIDSRLLSNYQKRSTESKSALKKAQKFYVDERERFIAGLSAVEKTALSKLLPRGSVSKPIAAIDSALSRKYQENVEQERKAS
ncbi:MAG: hypothetical protein KDD70_00415 [Bdellovibrionales bacterium]|nr:hypothetical protein [Bdellovibrionales bacterium]